MLKYDLINYNSDRVFTSRDFLFFFKKISLKVGDGTTSVVLLAGELLKEIKGYIEEGVSPHVIIKGYRKASQLV
jgi:hypothetical protein